ncbi:MAG: hypothetical protein ACK42E_04850 [Candidatus Bipolaricaulaceae bacterium]
MSFFLGLEALLLLSCGVLSALGASLYVPEIVVGGNSVSPLVVRAGLGALTAVFLVASGICAALAVRRYGLAQAMSLSGPKGLILITPRTVSQLVMGLLAEELGDTPFHVVLLPKGKALALRVSLRLPPEASVPLLAEHLQELLSTEVARRTGLEVQEVQVLVHGATARG